MQSILYVQTDLKNKVISKNNYDSSLTNLNEKFY